MFFRNSEQLNLDEQTFAFGALRVSGSQTFVKGAYVPQSGSTLDKTPPSKCKIVNQKQRCTLERKYLLYNIGFGYSEFSERVHFLNGISK